VDGVDHYAALGLGRAADTEAVRAAYRDAVRRWHPDRDPSPAAAAKFLAAQRAYQVLSDPKKRLEYDRETANGIGDLLLLPLPFLRRQAERLIRGGNAVLADLAERRKQREAEPPVAD
jgi:curved DNA-binding protein CbpA